MKKWLSLLLCVALALALCAAASADEIDTEVAYVTYGWVMTAGSADEAGYVTVEIMEVPNFERVTYTTAVPLDKVNALTGSTASDATVTVLTTESFIQVAKNAAGEVLGFERVEQTGGPLSLSGAKSYYYFFDSARFGGELMSAGGGVGNMVAMGWVLATDEAANTITIGDGNHVTNVFEETYTLADDAKIYAVDNGYAVEGEATLGSWEGEEITLADIVSCPPDETGEIYHNAEKYTALVIFDGDYTTYENGAKVTELYFFKNPTILKASEMNTPDDVQYSGSSWLAADVTESHGFSYDGSCTPFEVLADRLYSVGDAYTNIYLFIADDGTMTMLDEGNTSSSYQYWLNVAAMGYDPRQVDAILLTHGHGDHYQGLVENMNMINHYNVSQGNIAYGEQYASVTTSGVNQSGFDYLGYPEIGPTLTDASILNTITQWDTWYEWADLGGGVEVYPFLTTGHTQDTASFCFKFTATANDKVFEEGETIGYVYMGGYGAQNALKNGWKRLAYVDGLKYIQSVVAPMLEAEVDHIYNIPQHSNQYPWYEVAKAARTAGVPFMSVLQEGIDCIQNFCEKRISYNTYERFYQLWLNQEDEIGNLMEAVSGLRCGISSKTLQTIEAYGPYKRAAGEYTVTVESALILHGFDMWQNPNEAFAGQTSAYGTDVSQGLIITKDAFVHDPDSYFVQIVCYVNDDYAGKVDYDTNFYGAENYAEAWTSGPVELANRPTDQQFTEIIRTARVSSLEEAEQLLASITAGETYTVQLDAVSDIILADNLTDTFAAAK